MRNPLPKEVTKVPEGLIKAKKGGVRKAVEQRE